MVFMKRGNLRPLALLVVVVFSAGLLACGDDDNDNGNNDNNDVDFGEAYAELEGVWVSEDFEADGVEQRIIRDIDGADVNQRVVDPATEDVMFEANYRYEVGDEVEVTLDGDTVSARELDVMVVEYLEGADPEAETGVIFYDIFKITELDGDDIAYFASNAPENEANRHTELADLVYTRQ